MPLFPIEKEPLPIACFDRHLRSKELRGREDENTMGWDSSTKVEGRGRERQLLLSINKDPSHSIKAEEERERERTQKGPPRSSNAFLPNVVVEQRKRKERERERERDKGSGRGFLISLR